MTALYVVDTNVVVASLLTTDPVSPTRAILDAMLAAELRFALSTELLAEYREVLLRPALQRLHALTAGEIDEVLVRLVQNAVVAAPGEDGTPSGTGDDAHLFALLDRMPGALLVTGDARAARRARDRGRSPRALADELGLT